MFKSKVDFGFLLVVSNIILWLLAVQSYVSQDENLYINANIIALLCILCLQNLFFLYFERKKRDPLVVILIANTTIFYVFRVVTLTWDAYSVALSRSRLYSADLAYSLGFIILANAAIFAGIVSARRYLRSQEASMGEGRGLHPNKIILLLLVGFGVVFFGMLPYETLGKISVYATVFFFDLARILLFVFIWWIVRYKRISLPYKITVSSMFLLYFFARTLTGVRSGLLTLAIALFIAILAVRSKVVLSLRALVFMLLLLPLAGLSFVASTNIRSQGENIATSFRARGEYVTNEYYAIFSADSLQGMQSKLFDRMGFLDYTTEAIFIRDRLRRAVNFRYYFESIIDNCLTPGFNVYNSPKVANVIKYIAYDLFDPSHDDVNAAYQSDMLTVYGEYYILFYGYLALFAFFLAAFLFSFFVNSLKCDDVFLYFLKRALLFHMFYLWVNSFGLDWLVQDAIKTIAMYLILKYFYKVSLMRLLPLSPVS